MSRLQRTSWDRDKGLAQVHTLSPWEGCHVTQLWYQFIRGLWLSGTAPVPRADIIHQLQCSHVLPGLEPQIPTGGPRRPLRTDPKSIYLPFSKDLLDLQISCLSTGPHQAALCPAVCNRRSHFPARLGLKLTRGPL